MPSTAGIRLVYLGTFIEHRYSFAAAWGFAPILGLACGFFQWLFRRGDTKIREE